MAKKTTKPAQKTQKGRDTQIRRMASDTQYQEPGAPVATMERPAGPPVVSRPAARPTGRQVSSAVHELSRADEYRFIKSDLQRVAVLAAGIFAILGALTFVIR